MALPEKEWFTLNEIAQRWGCSVEDLWNYVETDKLRLSVFFSIPVPVKWFNDPSKPDFELTSGPLGIAAFTARQLAAGSVEEILLFAPPVHDEKPPRRREDDERRVFAFPALYDPDCPSLYKQSGTRATHAQGPIIARAERDRFERKYGIKPLPAQPGTPGAQGAVEPPPSKMTPAEQWKAASAEEKRKLAAAALREHGTQEKAAAVFGIKRQRLAAVLRNTDATVAATVASAFPASPWKPRKR